MAQIGIAIGALGIVLAFMGLFPGITGIVTGSGIGIVQFTAIWSGFTLLNLGAFLYVKFTIFPGRQSTFAQQIGVRLMLTGLVLAGMVGLADALGFGSHGIQSDGESYFGRIQGILFLACVLIAALGILVYAVMGSPPDENSE
jgi:hypothetical protein